MSALSELLAVDKRQALEFFLIGLRDVSDSDVDREELLYNASVLAHFAQVSTQSTIDAPTPAHLGAVFDDFVLNDTLHVDSLMMETAAAQCLLLAGFFETQMRERHNIRWYADLGAGFFRRAAALQKSQHRAHLLETLSQHFEAWRQRQARLGRELRDQPYLLVPPTIM